MQEFFKDKNNKLAVIQLPNLPLSVWFIALVLARLTSDPAANFFSVIETGALIVWAVLEFLYGSSPFRRVLGTVVLAFVVINQLS